MRRVFLISALMFLAGCSSAGDRPVINFIGVAEGTLTSNLQDLQFSQVFTPEQRELVAVVGFESVKEGTTVQATWFSPDDRQMPLGRSTLNIASGATIARFSFASREPWINAPYLLLVDAFSEEQDRQNTASGSLPFFIGMDEEEITEYQREYQAWKQAEAKQAEEWQAAYERKRQLLANMQKTLGFDRIGVLAETDVTGDGQADYVVHDGDDAPGLAGTPGSIAAGAVHQLAVADGSGSVLLSIVSQGKKRMIRNTNAVLFDGIPEDGPVTFSILPSLTVSLSWADDEQTCFAELENAGTGYALKTNGCR